MDLNDTPEQAEYRARVRAWIEENGEHAPEAFETNFHSGDPEPMRRWQRRLAEAGFVGVTWPEEYGGQGLTTLEQVIVNNELARAGVPGMLDHIGVGNIGPTLIAYGSEEQKRRYLSPLLHGDEIWCQLFSEPAAGSDLGAIQTRARQEDGGWRLNGQKVWTTNAQHAAFGMLLARTDPDVPKHQGLTMFAIPMDAEGVTVRPLRLMSGGSGFNEVFFDDVWLDADATVGPVDGGWGVAMTTLMFERLALLAAMEQLGWGPERFSEPLAGHPATADADVRRRFADVAIDLISLRFGGYRVLTQLQRGAIPGPEAGLSKITMINSSIEGAALLAEVLGPDVFEGEWGEFISDMPALRTGGGTEEIVRNMIGERVLALPPEPRDDKSAPFSELSAKRSEVAA
jgi:alkylation response protein AidB-like acyl-CoA dehydrogenase